MDVFTLKEGDSPLIISSPHTGTYVPGEIKARFTPEGQALPDTDKDVNLLYEDYAQAKDVTLIKANYSRYVVDMNRPPDDTPLYPGQTKVPLCPDYTFDGAPIYKEGQAPDDKEIAQRLEQYWRPYHDALAAQIARIKDRHGYALLYDAHSIRGVIPRLFEGQLPDLNLGTAGGKSCGATIEQAAFSIAEQSLYSAVLNGRFIGGYITRHYGRPDQNIHALQMEIAQHTHLDESGSFDENKAALLRPVLGRILDAVTDSARAGVKAEAVR